MVTDSKRPIFSRTRAAQAIAQILQRLELETGEHVTGVRIENLEITSCTDAHRAYLRRVEIDSIPEIGSNWEVGDPQKKFYP